MKNLTVQKGLVCMTQTEFARLQSHLARTEAEQAVLDVVRRWVDGDVTSVAHIAAAERHLRGLK